MSRALTILATLLALALLAGCGDTATSTTSTDATSASEYESALRSDAGVVERTLDEIAILAGDTDALLADPDAQADLESAAGRLHELYAQWRVKESPGAEYAAMHMAWMSGLEHLDAAATELEDMLLLEAPEYRDSAVAEIEAAGQDFADLNEALTSFGQ